MNQQEIIARTQTLLQLTRAELIGAERMLARLEEPGVVPPPQREPPKKDDPPPPVRVRLGKRPPWRRLRLPHVEWGFVGVPDVYMAHNGSKNQIGTAITSLLSVGGGTIRVKPGHYGEQKVTWGARTKAAPDWDALGLVPTVRVVCDDGVIIDGIQVHGGGYDLIMSNFSLSWVAVAQMAIGSTGGPIALRMHNVKAVQSAETEKPVTWLMRPYGIFLHLDECDFSAVPAKEHDAYLDTCWAFVANKTTFGPSGRTHIQMGYRGESAMKYYAHYEWPGIMIQDCLGVGLNSGAGGGSGLTGWGYHGPVQIDGWRMTSNPPDYVMVGDPPQRVNMNENKCFSIWEDKGKGGAKPPTNKTPYATPYLSINNVWCDYPNMDRPFGEIESVDEVWIGLVNGIVPKKWIDSPDQWPSGPVGSINWIPGEYERIEIRSAT